MKKRLFSLLLTVAMLAAMFVMPVSATEAQAEETVTQTTDTTQVGYCQHCKTVIPEDEWIPWDIGNTGPRTGHYYLDRDINDQVAQITINLDDDLCRNVICLDLRGRSYSTTTKRAFLIYGIFSIMDSVGGGEITATGSYGNANGTFCQMGKKSGCVDGAGELNLYSGTLRRVEVDEAVVAYGGLIYVSGGATFNMHGGKIIGGTVISRQNSSGTQLNGLGGTIFATSANVNLYGGTVTGGIARNLSVTQADGTVKEYAASGGNIYAEKNAKILIDGATVENGYCEGGGGNIYLKDATLELRSGAITGGYAEGASGNVNIGGASTFIMIGGVIRDGVCKTTGGNLRVNNSGAVLDISGGEIYGDIYANLFKSLTLSGAPKIYMGLSNGLRLYNTKTKLDVAGLTAGAEIYLDGVDQTFTEVLENAEVYAAYFKDAIRADITVTENGELAVAQGTTGFCPHCWESGEQATWTEWHNNNSTSTSVLNETGSVHYYLTGTVTRKGLVSIGTSSVKDNDIVFDAAGKTWTTTDKKLFNVYAQLSLLDSVGSGLFTGSGHSGANGGVIMGSGTAVINMYSGTLSRTVKSGEEMKGVLVGGVVYAPAGSVVNIYGGTIRDGISASISASGNYCRGGNVCAYGTFNMTAGALIGGNAYANSYISQDTANPVLVKNSAGEMVPAIRGGMGGNLYVSGKATISGGHIVGGNASMGGNVYISSTATPSVSDCVIREGVADATGGLVDPSASQTMYGGNLYIAGSSSKRMNLVIENAIIRDGSAQEYGGGIYATTADLTLRDCCFFESSAARGGNLYLSGSVVCDMYDTIVSKGYASGHGGNLYAPGGIAFNMYSGLFVSGETKGYGGNAYCNGLNMYGGIVTGGTAGSNGGNLYVYEGAGNYLNIQAAANAPAPIVSNGKGSSMGGNIALGKNTTGTITGAVIENGTGDTGNKSSGFNADDIFANVGTTLTLCDTVIRGIVSDANYGNGVYVGGELILTGATSVTNEDKKSCIYISSGGKLTVDAGFTGETSVAFEDAHFENPEEPQGGTLAEQNSATGLFTGKLLLEGYKGRDYSLPAIFAEEGDSKLYIASTAVIDPANDTVVWYRDNDAAAAAVTESSYLKLYKAENTLNLNRDLVIDLNGNNLTVTGEGAVSGFDSKNDDYTVYGNLITDGDIQIEKLVMAPNGRRYVAVERDTGTSFHRLGIAITGVSLRPSAQGIYYKAAWECDDVLKEKIEAFGVAVSTANMPTADFMRDADTLYTTMNGESFQSGQAVTSAMIENILVAGEDNQTRGTTAIYAAPYAVIDGMTVVADDNAPTLGGVVYSLQELMQQIDLRYPRLEENQKNSIQAMYNIDADTLAGWQLYNITAAIDGTLPVRPLKILTLGSSSSVDSNHMLNMVIAAEGGGAEVIVGTLYYSGCKLPQHVKFLQENAPVYTLYLSSTATPDKPPVTLKSVTMLDSLLYDDWDVIFLQAGGFESMSDDTFTNGNIEIIRNYVDTHKTNPDAIFGWHCIGVSSTDPELTAMYPYTPNSYEVNAAKYNYDRSLMLTERTSRLARYIMSDPDYVYVVPSCTATENAITSYLGQKGIKRDYTHLTDIGRLIASYVWFCELYGIEQLDEIKVDAIGKAFLKSTADKTQDLVLTEAEKAVILEAVNNTLKNPLEITQSQYTTAP